MLFIVYTNTSSLTFDADWRISVPGRISFMLCLFFLFSVPIACTNPVVSQEQAKESPAQGEQQKESSTQEQPTQDDQDASTPEENVADANEPIAEEPTPEPSPEPQPKDTPDETNDCEGLDAITGTKFWSIYHNLTPRPFTVYIPPQYKPNKSMPVVLNFHGIGSNPAQQQIISGMDSLAKEKGFITIHPQGVGNSWNGGLCCSPASSPMFVNDVGFVRAMLDYVEKKLCVDKKRIFATGLSNGAYMTYRLACELSDRIAAVAPVAGLLVASSCKPKRPISVMAFHGTGDAIVPYAGYPLLGWNSVQSSVDHFVKHNECQTAANRIFEKDDTHCDQYDGCKDNTAVTLCTTKNGGHTWPSGFPIPGFGITTRDIDATKEMWKFFQKHPL